MFPCDRQFLISLIHSLFNIFGVFLKWYFKEFCYNSIQLNQGHLKATSSMTQVHAAASPLKREALFYTSRHFCVECTEQSVGYTGTQCITEMFKTVTVRWLKEYFKTLFLLTAHLQNPLWRFFSSISSVMSDISFFLFKSPKLWLELRTAAFALLCSFQQGWWAAIGS